MLDLVFRISQLTTSVATVLGGAYVWVNKGGTEGIFFIFFCALFTLAIRYYEQQIFAENSDMGRIH